MPSYKDESTGKWYCSFYYTDLKGKRIRKLKRGFKFKRDADKFERDWLSTSHGDTLTMDALISAYETNLEQQYNKGNIKHSTLNAYQNRIRLYIKPYWKDVIVNLVKPKDIENWLAEITTKELKPLCEDCYYYKKTNSERKSRRSSRTVNNARAMMSRIFDFAQINYQISDNPVEKSSITKKFSQDNRAKLWTLEQYNVFHNFIKREDMRILFDILYYAGLRIGEALALTPNDIRPYHIVVNKALIQEDYATEYIDAPKNEFSVRTVEIPKFLFNDIASFLKKNKFLKENDIIFIMKEQTVRNHLDAQARKLNLPKISPHILRHSYASYLLSVCKDPMVVAKQLGHSTPETTLKFYSHMLPNNDRGAVDALEEFLGNKK